MRYFIYLFLFPILILSQSSSEEEINRLLDRWHLAATQAEEEIFFDFTMADDAIYIGTDASELWTKEEMKIWAKDIFQRETAWDFTVKSRNIYFSKNKKVAWFDEILDTWMGVCRGSGVLEKSKGKWKLKHYHLAIAVPNELVQEYLKLLPQ